MSHAIARMIKDQEFPNAQYAWVITRDRGHEMPTPGLPPGESEVGTCGPSLATEEMLELARTQGREFRLYDEGDIDECSIDDYPAIAVLPGHPDYGLVYEGRIWTADTEGGGEEDFGPLEDFGTPNDGCTEIRYRNDAGQWKAL